VNARLRGCSRQLVPALLAAALGLPVLAPRLPPAERALARAAIDAQGSPLTALVALASAAPERGPGRHDEGRRLDASLAQAGLLFAAPLRAAPPLRLVSRSREGIAHFRLARWCLAHSTSTAAP
jgi:hypothetical protein